MAWQLIYTSAPRLLEAGRTGFGTVARHRAVGGMLAASVERFSQFARLPGHDPRRVVHAHRILTVGSSTYHVLSCLQDAGSDYTGRTNHIAHHVIAEPREMRAAGVTPADVLLGMSWRSAWTEGPRFLDSSEEVNLASLASSRGSNAWVSVTGNPASAGILWSREAARGCYLILPSGISALELFRESSRVEPGEAWQTCFTTCLEPNDDVADFRWVALAASSPLRSQAEASSRTVLDLTHPASLPPPPERAPPVPALASPPAAPVETPHLAPAPVEAGHGVLAPPEVAASPAMSQMGSWSPEPRQKGSKSSSRSIIGISFVIAGVLVLAVVGALLKQDRLREDQNDARGAYEQAINTTWERYDLELKETRQFLAAQSNLETGASLLKSHEEFFRSMQPVLNQPGQLAPPPLPPDNQDDLRDLRELLERWTDLHSNPWKKLFSSDLVASAQKILATYSVWEDSRKKLWRKFSSYLDPKTLPPAGNEVIRELKAGAKEALRSAEPERGTRNEWEQVFELPAHPKSPAEPEVQRWLKLWADLDGGLYAEAQKNSGDKSLPEWLLKKAAEVVRKHDAGNGGTMTQTNPKENEDPANETPKRVNAVEDADSLSAENELYVCLLHPGEDPAGKIPRLKITADMQLYIGTAWDAHPLPNGASPPKEGELQKWYQVPLESTEEIKFGPSRMAKLTEMIHFSATGDLIDVPEEYRKSPAGLRAVARSKDGNLVLFDLRVLPLSSVASKPVFTKVLETTMENEEAVTLRLPPGFLNRLHLAGQAGPVYVLRHDGTASEQQIYRLSAASDGSFTVVPPKTPGRRSQNRVFIENQIKELEAGIKGDEQLLANVPSSLPDDLETQKKEFYTRSIAERKAKLEILKAQLAGPESLIPVHFELMPGHYTLMLEKPAQVELCKLHVVPAEKTTNLKRSNP